MNQPFSMSDLVMVRLRSPWQWSDLVYRNTEKGKKHDGYLKVLQQFTRDVSQDVRHYY